MGKLGGLDKKAFVTHVDDVEWKEVGDGLRIKELLCEKTAGKTEFYFGVAELEAGKDIPLHRYNLAHCNYILEGEVWARLGRQRFQLEAEASNYFSIGVPHAYEASGKNGVPPKRGTPFYFLRVFTSTNRRTYSLRPRLPAASFPSV